VHELTDYPWAGVHRPAYPLENAMPQAKSPATRTATDDQADTRTAEPGTPIGPDDRPERAEQSSPAEQPEPDSHDDLVARVRNLERHIL
jgi:hypothetical protein